MKYEKVERMLRNDFEVARGNGDLREMADDYELLRELWSTGELDSEDYHDVLSPMVHCFVQVKDNKIELPSLYKTCNQHYGKKAIYCLEKDSIKLIIDNVDEKIFSYFNETGIETKYIVLENFVELNAMAIRTLKLHNADIVELCIDDDMIVITKEL